MPDRKCTLRCLPAGLGLPTLDPAALAVETNLRLQHIRIKREDRHQLSLAPPPPELAKGASAKKTKQEAVGLYPCLKASIAVDADGSEEVPQGVATLNEQQAAIAVMIETTVAQVLMPAFSFLILYDPVLYRHCFRGGDALESRVASFGQRLRGSYRQSAIAQNPFYISTGASREGLCKTVLPLSSMNRIHEVVATVMNSLGALERLLSEYGGKTTSDGTTFFFGTSRPSSQVDALVFAGISSFAHADATKVLPTVPFFLQLQKYIRNECPRLTHYVEQIRKACYEEYRGRYALHPIELPEVQASEAAAAERELLYRDGRTRVVVLTTLFALCYFIVVNAGILVEWLEEEELAEEEEAPVEEADPVSS